MAESQVPVSWPQVVAVAGVVVVVVLGAALLTGLLPPEVQRFVFHSPLLIGVLIAGTVLVLWRVARQGAGPH